MRKLEWFIDYVHGILDRRGIVIYFDDIEEDDNFWHFYLNGKLVSSVFKKYNKIWDLLGDWNGETD